MEKAQFNISLKKETPHEQAAKVNEIVNIVGLSEKYNYQFWLGRVKKYSFGQILEICKKAKSLESKYNKGGYITNQLCKKK